MTDKIFKIDYKSVIELYSLKNIYMEDFRNILKNINQEFHLDMDLNFKLNLLKKKDIDEQQINKIQAGILIHKV